jgi:hypothetical protein
MTSILSILKLLTGLVCVSYVLFSFVSAVRMSMVHNHYAHIEFNQSKWRTFGKWAPQRLRTLVTLRRAAFFAFVAWVAVSLASLFAQ